MANAYAQPVGGTAEFSRQYPDPGAASARECSSRKGGGRRQRRAAKRPPMKAMMGPMAPTVTMSSTTTMATHGTLFFSR